MASRLLMSGTLLMKSLLNLIRFRLGVVALLLVSGSLWAQTPAAAPATPPPRRRPMSASLRSRPISTTPIRPKAPLVGVAGPGHNAWMMTSSALVLFMTLPGLALFYGGLVRKKNVLSVLAQCLGMAGMVTIMWWAFGYSFVFGKSFNSPFLGGTEFLFLKGVTSAPNTDYAYWVSQNVFSMYQMMFAIITPGADRRCDRRAHEIHRDHWLSSRSGCWSSTSRWPTWSGARLAT